MRWMRALVLAAGASLMLAACAADATDVDTEGIDDAATSDDDDGASDDDGAGSDDSVSLVANPWPGSYANVHVAEAVIESELGVDTEIVEIDENAQWAGLDDGSLDAVLEIWPSGHQDNLETYVDDLGSVELLGELGVLGEIGWFVPDYILDEYPEMATWEGLEGNEEIFATAETGDSGQFLAADPSFVQFDEAIIDNLDLDF